MRITPACAGKTCILADDNLIREDHPRVCGENKIYPRRAQGRQGSPPRVRGKRICHHLLALAGRITPACAGKTHSWRRTDDAAEDHPRVCGENS